MPDPGTIFISDSEDITVKFWAVAEDASAVVEDVPVVAEDVPAVACLENWAHSMLTCLACLRTGQVPLTLPWRWAIFICRVISSK
jgi:hypothetical protein